MVNQLSRFMVGPLERYSRIRFHMAYGRMSASFWGLADPSSTERYQTSKRFTISE
jgi:hypothetical protein